MYDTWKWLARLLDPTVFHPNRKLSPTCHESRSGGCPAFARWLRAGSDHQVGPESVGDFDGDLGDRTSILISGETPLCVAKIRLPRNFSDLRGPAFGLKEVVKSWSMTCFLLDSLSWFAAFFRSRHDLGLELVALRQQVGVLKRKNPRPQLGLLRSALPVRPPALVVTIGERAGDREAGDRRRLASRRVPRVTGASFSPRRPGRPKITPELRHLIRSMTAENPTWGG